MKYSLQVTHVIENLDDSYGGPSRSLPEFVHSLSGIGIKSDILYIRKKNNDHNTLVEKYLIDSVSFCGQKLLCFSFTYSFFFIWQAIKGRMKIVHFHSVWSYPSWLGMTVCGILSIPYVVSPRSSLYSKSIENRKTFKDIISSLFLRKLLNNAAFFHATDATEANDLRLYGYKGPIYTIPHGVCTEEFDRVIDRNSILKKMGLNFNLRYILFFSRIHQRKNLDVVIEAMGRMTIHSHCLLIAGPIDDQAYFNMIIARSKVLGIESKVKYIGMVTGRARAEVFSISDVFVLLSDFENFGMSIAEAMAARKAVLISTNTPWTEIVESGCGRAVDVNVGQVACALEELTSLNLSDIKKKGLYGREYVEKGFSWDEIAIQFKCLYSGTIKNG